MSDLFGRDFDVLTEPLVAGSTFNIEYEIGNLGSIVNGPFQVSFYLSKNNIIDPNAGLDILLGSSTINGLGANASTNTLTRSLTLPGVNNSFWQTNSGNGTYHIGMVIDSLNQVTETNETNNRNRGFLLDWDDVVINNTLQADLVGTSANVVVEPQTAGNILDFEYNIRNIGGATTGGNYTVSFYLSDNTTISTADRLLGTTTLSGLAAGANTGTLTQQLTLPGVNNAYWRSNGGNGTYSIGMIVDSANTIAESNETNNSNQGELIDRDTFTINGTTVADLVGTSANVVVEPQTAGNTLDFEYNIRNIGGAATGGNYTVSFYLSDNTIISTADRLLSTTTLSSLAAGANTGTLTQQLTLPGVNDTYWRSNGGNGNYSIGMIIDSANVIAESNESNNRNQGELVDRDTLQITGTQKADLLSTLSNVVIEPQNAGSTFTYEFDISNQGDLASGSFDVAFYLSRNSIISTSDQLLGTTTVSSLSANGSTGTRTVQLTLPGINDAFWQGDGTYHIGTIIDRSNTVDESNEANNRNRGLLLDYDDVIINNTAQLGQRSNDDFIGTGGDDQFQGLRGDDNISGGGGNDDLSGGRGDDDINGNAGDDRLLGEWGDDVLFGGRGDDVLFGGHGDDVLIGVDRANTVNPGTQQVDRLTGGFGNDFFVLGSFTQSYYTDSVSTDYAVITDFTASEDIIVLHGSASDYTLGTPAASLPTGAGIFRGTELVAIVQGNTTGLSLTSSTFEYYDI